MSQARGSDQVVIDMVALRAYLSGAVPTSGDAILHDAFTRGVVGALALVELAAGTRVNVRSRRTMDTVRTEFSRRPSQRARWLTTLGGAALSLWNVLRHQGVPYGEGSTSRSLERLPREARRQLRSTGLVGPTEQSLQSQAADAARAVWDSVHGRQCVVWVDNWAWMRWGTDPSNPSYSQNVTVLAVLVMDDLQERTVRTRAVSFPTFPGHPELSSLVRHVPWAAGLCAASVTTMHRVVRGMNATDINPRNIRVPLDVRRTDIRSLGWRPLSLTTENVSANIDLLGILQSVLEVQRRTGRHLPLLVDENIHYRTLRLLYASSMLKYDMAYFLENVPLLYGIWHPYKHTLTVVYRAFFPVFCHLESQVGQRPSDRTHRRVLFMEKMIAAILLARPRVLPHVEAMLSNLETDTDRLRYPAKYSYALNILSGIRSLLLFYAPLLLHLGYIVRQCTWCGRPDGSVRGDTARSLLEYCLLIQTHVLQDWQCSTNYVRTISLALLSWQPWMSRLPGCAFVEESCEGMNSRLASACRRAPNVTTFEGTLHLYLTLPATSSEPYTPRGALRQELIREMERRLLALAGNPAGRSFPCPLDATRVRWVSDVDPCATRWRSPDPLPREVDQARLEVVIHRTEFGRHLRSVCEITQWSSLKEHIIHDVF